MSVVLDKRLLDITPLNFHPLRNDRTTAIATSDFLKFLEAVKHPPQIIDVPAQSSAALPAIDFLTNVPKPVHQSYSFPPHPDKPQARMGIGL